MFEIFIINGRDYSFFIIGGTGALIYFAAQLAFCLKAKKIVIKLIPLYVFLIPVVYCALLGFGAFGSQPVGSIDGNKIIAMVFGVIIGIAAIGEILAWVVYGFIRHSRKRD